MEQILKAPKQFRQTIKNVSRLRSILKVLVKYGFQDVVQKSNLASYLPGTWGQSETSSLNTPQRFRMCLEELGPTFIKLGQLLASRPDVVPQPVVDELKKLQDQVPAVPYEKILKVLEKSYGDQLHNMFLEIDPTPLGSASIAQVHRATLQSGVHVVLKIQKPGIAQIMHEDINVLKFIVDALERYFPESRLFNPRELVNEFAYSLEMETNFIVEGNNVRRFAENFHDDKNIKIPKSFLELSSAEVLVLEYLEGTSLRAAEPGISTEDRESLMKIGLQAYFDMVFKHGLFHGDLHAGNLLILSSGQIGFIDFGMVGRLSRRVKTSIANMFVALASEDYDRLAYEYLELSTQSIDVDRDEFARDLRMLLSPFFGLNLRNVNLGKLLIDSASIAFKNKVYLPSELLLFFKSIVTLEGLGRGVQKDFDLLPYVYDFSSEIVRLKYDPGLIVDDISAMSREWSSLFRTLPADIKNIARKINHPDYAKKIEFKDADHFFSLMTQLAYLMFFGILVASLVVGGSMTAGLIHLEQYYGLPVLSWVLYGAAFIMGLFAFYHYVRKK
ncbi:MAG: AarF/ABC1/UbiB kinase family protein [Bdellovibrionaceae bacterium]|nr:AarF/ABC1/UbiB kinase family protein [Pseudobdellovibrionaceae bacterium]